MKPVPAGIYLTMLQLSELVTPAFAHGHAHKFPTTQGRLTESPLPLWAGQSHMTSVLQHGSFLHAEARRRGAAEQTDVAQHLLSLARPYASFDRLRMRENLSGTKKSPHPELVEGRIALIPASLTSASPRLRVTRLLVSTESRMRLHYLVGEESLLRRPASVRTMGASPQALARR